MERLNPDYTVNPSAERFTLREKFPDVKVGWCFNLCAVWKVVRVDHFPGSCLTQTELEFVDYGMLLPKDLERLASGSIPSEELFRLLKTKQYTCPDTGRTIFPTVLKVR